MDVSRETKIYNKIIKFKWLLILPPYFFIGYSFYSNFNKVLSLRAEALAVSIMAKDGYKRVVILENKLKKRIQKQIQETVEMQECEQIIKWGNPNGRNK